MKILFLTEEDAENTTLINSTSPPAAFKNGENKNTNCAARWATAQSQPMKGQLSPFLRADINMGLLIVGESCLPPTNM